MFLLVTGGGLVLLAAAALTLAQDRSEPLVRTHLGYSELPDGRGGTNVEAIAYTEAMGFDYVEPAIWTIEWPRDFYGYPITRSN